MNGFIRGPIKLYTAVTQGVVRQVNGTQAHSYNDYNDRMPRQRNHFPLQRMREARPQLLQKYLVLPYNIVSCSHLPDSHLTRTYAE